MLAAAALIACSFPGSTLSFEIDLNAYKNFAYVERYQYPQTRKQFYEIKQERTVKGVREITLNNEEIYVQAERTLILRMSPKETTLEVFFFQGPIYPGGEGRGGSTLYHCDM